MSRTRARLLFVCSLLALTIVACGGGGEKNKNKDKDQPKSIEAK